MYKSPQAVPMNTSLSAGEFLEDSLQHDYLNKQDELALIAQAKAGDTNAMMQLVNHNEKLIYALALKAFRAGITGTAEMVDLQQLGRMGLMKAIEKYDASTGYRLSTYATWWIRQHINRFGVAEGSAFSLSHRDNEFRTKLSRCRVSMELTLMRDVSIEEVAEKCGISIDTAKRLMGLRYTSMDADYEDSQGNDPRLQIPNQASATEEVGTNQAMIAQVREIIAGMPETWQKVMRLRYPLDGGEPLPYREIAADLGVTHQRIAQIEDQAMKLLKSKIVKYT